MAAHGHMRGALRGGGGGASAAARRSPGTTLAPSRGLGGAAHPRPAGRRPPAPAAAAADAPPPPAAAGTTAAADLSDAYSGTMQAAMASVGGGGLHYRHEDGVNYTRMPGHPELIVGSCLQAPADAAALAARERVAAVLCLQEDCDMAYFGLDLAPVVAECGRVGIAHLRHRVRDFDPFSLRRELPGAAALLLAAAEAAAPAGAAAYVHCTAGMGRAPAAALAYLWWGKGVPLEAAAAALRAARPCSPNLAAVRAAAADLLFGGDPTPCVVELRRRGGGARRVQVAGLDVGWGLRLEARRAPDGAWVLERALPPGEFQYKWIHHLPAPSSGGSGGGEEALEERWSASMDHPTVLSGGNVNNVLAVPHVGDAAARAGRARVLAPGGELTADERAAIVAKLRALAAAPTGGFFFDKL